MIDAAVTHIARELNQYLKRTFDLTEDVVVVSNILEQDGTVATHVNNKIVVSLVNISRDTVPFRQKALANTGADRLVVSSQPIFLNIHLMFAAYFSGNNYQQGLRFLSNTIAFFQGQPVFDHHSSPEMDRQLDRLVLDIENLDINDLSSLWSILSGKYLPSILYKVRMVTVDSGAVKTQTPSLTNPESFLNH
jgi:hypothetical protein